MKKRIRTYVMMAVIALTCMLAAPHVIFADVDTKAHWPVQVTAKWNAVYGTVTGVTLDKGDSIGMFDTSGNCYGAGLYDGANYFLSAFMAEDPNPAIAGDFGILGFKEGDTVIFKIYRANSGTEVALNASSGTYTYTYQGSYPAVNINLVYNSDAGKTSGRTVFSNNPVGNPASSSGTGSIASVSQGGAVSPVTPGGGSGGGGGPSSAKKETSSGKETKILSEGAKEGGYPQEAVTSSYLPAQEAQQAGSAVLRKTAEEAAESGVSSGKKSGYTEKKAESKEAKPTKHFPASPIKEGAPIFLIFVLLAFLGGAALFIKMKS